MILRKRKYLCQWNGVEIPQEVYETTEKMLEFVMYCSNADGTVSNIIDKSQQNIRECLYWGSKLYKRSDFRYVAFGGLNMENSFQPEKTNVVFPESRIYIFRNNWDIRDRMKTNALIYDELHADREITLTYNNNKLVISGYSGKLAEVEFHDSKEEIKWANDKGNTYIKKGETEIILVEPKYLIIKAKDSFKIKGETLNQSQNILNTVHKEIDNKFIGLMRSRGRGELELIPMDQNSLIEKAEDGFNLTGGNYFVYFYSDDFTKRKIEFISEKDTEKIAKAKAENVDLKVTAMDGKTVYYHEQRLVPDIQVKIQDNELSLSTAEEDGTITIKTEEEKLIIENNIRKKIFGKNLVKDFPKEK